MQALITGTIVKRSELSQGQTALCESEANRSLREQKEPDDPFLLDEGQGWEYLMSTNINTDKRKCGSKVVITTLLPHFYFPKRFTEGMAMSFVASITNCC